MDTTPVIRKKTHSRLSMHQRGAAAAANGSPKTPIEKNAPRTSANENSPTTFDCAASGYSTPAHRRSRGYLNKQDEGSPCFDSDSGYSPGSFMTQEAPVGDVDYEWEKSDRPVTKRPPAARRLRKSSASSTESELHMRNQLRQIEKKKKAAYMQATVLDRLLELSSKQRSSRKIELDSDLVTDTVCALKGSDSSGSSKTSGYASNNNEVFDRMFEESFELPDDILDTPAEAAIVPQRPQTPPVEKHNDFEDLFNDSDSDILLQASQKFESATDPTIWTTCNTHQSPKMAATALVPQKPRDDFKSFLQDSFNDEVFGTLELEGQAATTSAKKKPVFGRHQSMNEQHSPKPRFPDPQPIAKTASSDSEIKARIARNRAEAAERRRRRLMEKKSVSDSQLPKTKYK